MNGVIGMTDLLLETALDAVQRDYAQTVRDSAQALLTVINDILDFSKIEAGKLDLEHTEIDVRDTVDDVARLISIQAHAKALEVTANIDSVRSGSRAGRMSAPPFGSPFVSVPRPMPNSRDGERPWL